MDKDLLGEKDETGPRIPVFTVGPWDIGLMSAQEGTELWDMCHNQHKDKKERAERAMSPDTVLAQWTDFLHSTHKCMIPGL